MRLRGAFDEEDSGSGRTEGPSWNDDSSYDDDEDDDAELVDLSEIDKGNGENETNTDSRPVAQEEKFEDGGGGTIEDLLSRFLERQEDESDSDDITHEWIRNMPESLKDDAEFMAEFDRLGETLIAKRSLPRPSLAERVHAKFVAAAQEGKEELVKYEPYALLTLALAALPVPVPSKSTLLLSDVHRRPMRAARVLHKQQRHTHTHKIHTRSLFDKYSKDIEGLVNARCAYVNITALMHAAANGHYNVVKALLKRGGDVSARGRQTRTYTHTHTRHPRGHTGITSRRGVAAANPPYIWRRSF